MELLHQENSESSALKTSSLAESALEQSDVRALSLAAVGRAYQQRGFFFSCVHVWVRLRVDRQTYRCLYVYVCTCLSTACRECLYSGICVRVYIFCVCVCSFQLSLCSDHGFIAWVLSFHHLAGREFKQPALLWDFWISLGCLPRLHTGNLWDFYSITKTLQHF